MEWYFNGNLPVAAAKIAKFARKKENNSNYLNKWMNLKIIFDSLPKDK